MAARSSPGAVTLAARPMSEPVTALPAAAVVLPTYNEAKNLVTMLGSLRGPSLPALEVIVVDDNSPDGTGKLAEALRVRDRRLHVIHRPGKLGLGSAYVAGFRKALELGFPHIIQMDADHSHDPAHLPHMLRLMADHDVVTGSRYVEGGRLDRRWGRRRRMLSAAGNLYARRVLGVKVKDLTSGFKCFRRRALGCLDLDAIHSSGYAFQIEVAYQCQQRGLRVKEIPIHFLERNGGRSKMSLTITLEALWRVWEIKWRYRQ